MSSGSGQRLSVEELKKLNQPSAPSLPAMQPAGLTRQDWEDLLSTLSALYRLECGNSGRLEGLEQHTEAHTALLREVSRRREPCPAQAQIEALARDVAQMRAELKQAGKKKEKRFCKWLDRLPDFDLTVVVKWIVLVSFIVAVLLGLGYGTATVISGIRDLLP
nr:hypothetical protein [uncultured Oscillibacter sp.]